MRIPRRTRFTLFALLLLPAGLVVAGALLSPLQVRDALVQAGYRDIHDLELDHGLWEATVTRADGRRAEVEVDRATGEIFDAGNGRPRMDMPSVIASLERAGYTRIVELDREGAVWDIEAVDRSGTRVELRVSGYDGRILDRETEFLDFDRD